MWLLNKFLARLVKKGELIVTDHDGKVYTYGAPEPGVDPIKVRLTDKGAAFAIASDPRLGAGEAYMDGRLVGRSARNAEHT
jgi:cyclopropane-fatty-acyl-phospholipid synthase